MCKLFKGGDRWRIKKSLELLLKMVGDKSCLSVGKEFFEALASIILQPMRSLQENDEERKWIYLIADNQERTIDHGILRLINSCLYSQKAKNAIAYNFLKIINSLINANVNAEYNLIDFSDARNIPEALVKILVEENGDEDVIKLCVSVTYKLVMCDNYRMDNISICSNLMDQGIFEALMLIMESHPSVIEDMLLIISQIVLYKRNIPRLVTAGLLTTLVGISSHAHNLTVEVKIPLQIITEKLTRFSRS